MEFVHCPVLADEVISGLNVKKNGSYLDCTVGGAGHSYLIASKLENGRLICVDKDDDALNVSKRRLEKFDFVRFIKSDYKNLESELLFESFDGILIDMGVSSYQIDNGERGFSFNHDGPLDMRMDKKQKLDAKVVVNTFSKENLEKIIFEFGEEKFAKSIVANIVKQRQLKPVDTTFQLKEIIDHAVPAKYRFQGAYKKTFQALRIFVNNELEGLDKTLRFLVSKLNEGGRLAVITFHSLEDRIVKNTFKELSTDCICPPKTPICVCNHRAQIKLISRKPIIASEQEIAQNPRSRTAKLRVVQKI